MVGEGADVVVVGVVVVVVGVGGMDGAIVVAAAGLHRAYNVKPAV